MDESDTLNFRTFALRGSIGNIAESVTVHRGSLVVREPLCSHCPSQEIEHYYMIATSEISSGLLCSLIHRYIFRLIRLLHMTVFYSHYYIVFNYLNMQSFIHPFYCGKTFELCLAFNVMNNTRLSILVFRCTCTYISVEYVGVSCWAIGNVYVQL